MNEKRLHLTSPQDENLMKVIRHCASRNTPVPGLGAVTLFIYTPAREVGGVETVDVQLAPENV